ncbi:MAG: hypothetical protein LBL04_14120 [Bacteroidales bacterium]|nr:hypothetical protein [Bacteroidales bacterium]
MKHLFSIIAAIGACVGIAGLILGNTGIAAFAACVLIIGGVPLIAVLYTLRFDRKWREENKKASETQQQ